LGSNRRGSAIQSSPSHLVQCESVQQQLHYVPTLPARRLKREKRCKGASWG